MQVQFSQRTKRTINKNDDDDDDDDENDEDDDDLGIVKYLHWFFIFSVRKLIYGLIARAVKTFVLQFI